MLLNVQESFQVLPKMDNTANKTLKKSIAFIENRYKNCISIWLRLPGQSSQHNWII